jgi:hypothetical protein
MSAPFPPPAVAPVLVPGAPSASVARTEAAPAAVSAQRSGDERRARAGGRAGGAKGKPAGGPPQQKGVRLARTTGVGIKREPGRAQRQARGRGFAPASALEWQVTTTRIP